MPRFSAASAFWALISSRPVSKSNSESGAPDNSSQSHFSATTWPRWLRRAVRNRLRHAIEQASRRWRGDRRDDSARTRRNILISTQVASTRSAPPARPSTRSAARPRATCASATPSTLRPCRRCASAALTGYARSRRSGAARPSTRSRSSGSASPRGTRRSTPRRRSGGSARWTQRSPAARRLAYRLRHYGAATRPTRSPTTSSRIRSRPGSSRRLCLRTK